MEKQAIHSYQTFNERSFVKNNIFKSKDSTVFILNFLPGQHMPAHFHLGSELNFHILQGNGLFEFDGKGVEVSSGDVIYCEGTEKVAFTNTSSGQVSIYVTMSKVTIK